MTDIWEFGTLVTTSSIFVMLIHMASEFRSWVSAPPTRNRTQLIVWVGSFWQTYAHVGTLMLSVCLYVTFALVYNGVCVDCAGLSNPFWVMQASLVKPVFWATLLITCVLALVPR